MTSPKFIGTVLLLALLAASSSHAQGRKKGGRKGKSTSTDLSSGLTLVPPSSLMTPMPAPAASTPPPSTDWKPKPATPEPAAAPAAEGPPEEADADRPRISLLPLVALGVEPLWEGRVFRQTDSTPPTQRRYDAIGYPSFALTAEFFPLANVRSKFLRGFGLTGHFARAFGFESASTSLGGNADPSTPVDAFYMRYAAGLRYRIHTNPESERPLVLGISASLCRWYFYYGSEVPGGWDVEVPTANYRMTRIGLDAALEVKRVTFYGYLNYLHAFSIVAPSTRELDVSDPYFFGAAGMGGEFRGAVGVRLARWIELRLSLEYGILAFRLKPLEGQVGSATVLDSYLSAGLGPYVSF